MVRKRAETRVTRIKTGGFERRLSLTKAGLFAGTRMATHVALNAFAKKDTRRKRRKAALSKQANYLVAELGKLKGSVVKIGQIMALYGEHFLPVEVTEALHTLENQTAALEWPVIHAKLREEIGEQCLAELSIEETPIGAASLGQVHRARRERDGRVICLKIQYPGVAEAVDSDLDAVVSLLKLARVIKAGAGFDDWLAEVRAMMHREVNYQLELETTLRFKDLLATDSRFVVPEIFPEYSTQHVLATSYEPGYDVTDDRVQSLPLDQRNQVAAASLDIFLREIFYWHELQTDPNFGNYLIRLNPQESNDPVQVVLLDFGAVLRYPVSMMDPLAEMIRGSYYRDRDRVDAGAVALKFMSVNHPPRIRKEFADLCMDVLEPLSIGSMEIPADALNEKGDYCWKGSELPTRIARRAAIASFTPYFELPPREFVFITRKLVGVYTFISVLDAQFDGRPILAKYVGE